MKRPKRSIEVPGLSHGAAPIPMGARIGPLLCSSAISGRRPGTGALPSGAAEQAEQAFANLRALLDHGGASLADVVRMTVTIKHDGVRDTVNAEWLKCFPDPHDRPARHIALADLAKEMLLQIEIIAYVEESPS